MEKLSRVLFVLLCHCTCVSKQAVFHADAPRIDRIVQALDRMGHSLTLTGTLRKEFSL